MIEDWVGRIFDFPDGAKMKIIQVKLRDDGQWVTWEAQFPGSLPKRTVQPLQEFLNSYSHLFV